MIQAKTGIVVLLIGLAAIYTFYVPPHEDAVTQSLPEYYWYNEVTRKTQWEEPIFEFESEDGETYWLDPETGKATWDKPESLAWILAEEPGGKIYYWNDVTEESQWEKPENLAWIKVKYEPPSQNDGDGEPDSHSHSSEL